MTETAPNPELEARKLADLEGAIDEQLKGVQLRQATIVSYDAGTQTATIRLGGDTTDVAGVKALGSYVPTAGDTGVWVIKNGTDLLLLGATGSASGPSPSGAITGFGGAAAPAGWLMCDGAAVSRTTYASLFTAIGTAYGTGDGSTTFNLPNLVGRFPLGDSGSTVLGNTGGSSTSAHIHDLDSSNSAALITWGGTAPQGRLDRKTVSSWTDNIDVVTATAGAGGQSNTAATRLTGDSASAAPTNMPPYQVVNYIIKT